MRTFEGTPRLEPFKVRVTERYAQCYLVDNRQDQVDNHMTYAEQVERSIGVDTVFFLPRLLRDINSYVHSFSNLL